MSDQSNKVSASPKVRKFARELGVDINMLREQRDQVGLLKKI